MAMPSRKDEKPVPRIRETIMVRKRASQGHPAAIVTMRLVNLRPSPEAKTDPMMIPAHAHAMDAGRVFAAPSSRAEGSC